MNTVSVRLESELWKKLDKRYHRGVADAVRRMIGMLPLSPEPMLPLRRWSMHLHEEHLARLALYADRLSSDERTVTKTEVIRMRLEDLAQGLAWTSVLEGLPPLGQWVLIAEDGFENTSIGQRRGSVEESWWYDRRGMLIEEQFSAVYAWAPLPPAPKK